MEPKNSKIDIERIQHEMFPSRECLEEGVKLRTVSDKSVNLFGALANVEAA